MSSKDPFESEAFCKIEEEHLYNCINFLIKEGIEFAVVAKLEYIEFDPILPKSIIENLPDVSLFILSGYSFESSRIDKKELVFEAGFGAENFGSIVSIPLLGIAQVIVEDYPIAINVAKPYLKQNKVFEVESSMEALLNRPENSHLLKK